MDEYNWDDFDSQASEYLNSSDYQGQAFETGDGQQWGGQGDPNSQYNFNQVGMPTEGSFDNLGQMFSFQNNPGIQNSFSLPQGTFDLPQSQQQFGFNNAGTGIEPNVEMWGGLPQMPANGADQSNDYWGKGLDGLSSFLGGLFNNKQGQNPNLSKQLGTLAAAVMEGRQNKQMASQIPQTVQEQQKRQSPFDVASTGATQMGANSMRDAMQQKLAAAMQDPYGQKIVKDQVDAIAKAQAIKDAASGRRSNMATSSPAMLAEQAKVAQSYINSLQNPAGANINPTSQGLEQMMQALRYNTNGYASPLMSSLGYTQATNQNSDVMAALRQALGGS